MRAPGPVRGRALPSPTPLAVQSRLAVLMIDRDSSQWGEKGGGAAHGSEAAWANTFYWDGGGTEGPGGTRGDSHARGALDGSPTPEQGPHRGVSQLPEGASLPHSRALPPNPRVSPFMCCPHAGWWLCPLRRDRPHSFGVPSPCPRSVPILECPQRASSHSVHPQSDPNIWGWGWGDPPDSGLHAQCPIQPHHLPIDHGVLGQGLHQVGVLSRVPQPRRERHLLSQKLPDLLRQTGQQRGGEQPWGTPKTGSESGHSPSSPCPPGVPLALPGAMVTTRMPSGARSRAMGRVMPTMPPLEAE